MQELIYTSSQSGLKPGVSGFCSVAWTRGISVPLIEPLENLSGYKPLYLPGDPRCDQNPVIFACQKVHYGSLHFIAVSRIADAGLDYTGRSNKIAHHIVPEDADCLQETGWGHAGLLLVPENFCSSWSGEPRFLPNREPKLPPLPQDTVCRTWQKYKGDAGFAGVVARRAIKMMQMQSGDPGAAIFLAYPPEMPSCDVLQMIAEVLLLLPPALRLQCTFSTYFVQQQLGVDCLLRAAPENSPLIGAMRRLSPERVIDLAKKESLPESDLDAYVAQARTGIPSVSLEAPAEHPAIHLEMEMPQEREIPLTLRQEECRKTVPFAAPASQKKAHVSPPEPPRERNLGKQLGWIAAVLLSLIAFFAFFSQQSGRKTECSLTEQKRERSEKPSTPPAGKETTSAAPVKTQPPAPARTEVPVPPNPLPPKPKAEPIEEARTAGAVILSAPEEAKNTSPAEASLEILKLQISEQFVPSLTGNREKTPQEFNLMEKYTVELRELNSRINAWNKSRDKWFQAHSQRKTAEKNWKNALADCGVNPQDILSGKEFQSELKSRLKKIRQEKNRKKKEALPESLKEWLAVHFPPLAATEPNWESDFEAMEEALFPNEKSKETPRPDDLQNVFLDAQKKHQMLYPLFRKKTDAEQKEKGAEMWMRQSGDALLNAPFADSEVLHREMADKIKKRKPVNLGEIRKIVHEVLSEKLNRELKQEK